MSAKERRCGNCDACCTVLNIGPPLDKPAGTRCVHLNGHGCGVYANRPAPCAQFRCGWHLGHGKNADRPDKVGVMLHAVPVADGTVLAEAGIRIGIQAYELREGALERPGRGVDLIRDLATALSVTILHTDGRRRLVGPPEVIERIQAALAARDVAWRPEGDATPSPTSG
jgi:hypothetical protein